MSFDAAKARTKYAMPVWVDAFVRDTLDLSADEIGAYNLLLWAMWSRESCDLPDDDRKLARVARVTPQTWKRRVRPSLEVFFVIARGTWSSVRLMREAAKTEKFLKAQSDRKTGGDQKNEAFTRHHGAQLENKNIDKNQDKLLKTNKPPSTADITMDASPDHPTQETKRPSIGGGDAGAREENHDQDRTEREIVLEAIGADPISGLIGPNGQCIGRLIDMREFRSWKQDLGLELPEIIEVIRDVMTRKQDGPPSTFTYFTQPMQRFAGQKSRPALTPIEGGQYERNNKGGTTAGRAHQGLIAGFARAVSKEP